MQEGPEKHALYLGKDEAKYHVPADQVLVPWYLVMVFLICLLCTSCHAGMCRMSSLQKQTLRSLYEVEERRNADLYIDTPFCNNGAASSILFVGTGTWYQVKCRYLTRSTSNTGSIVLC